MRPLSKKNREVMNKTLEAKEIKEIAEEMGKNYDAVQRMINRSIKIMASLCALEI